MDTVIYFPKERWVTFLRPTLCASWKLVVGKDCPEGNGSCHDKLVHVNDLYYGLSFGPVAQPTSTGGKHMIAIQIDPILSWFTVLPVIYVQL